MGSAEKIVKYDVSTQAVSFHNPLHASLASFLIESLYYGPPPVPGSAVPWVTNWGLLLEKSMAKVLQLNGVGERNRTILFDTRRQC
ncbi:hypothetical protein GQ600_14614 [Phytophthora cactorum]|nr:hypothetical protein GQ600_14614 [Phytophthora cactorum]